MRHLTPETLARIADGPATGEERTHLTDCGECRAELDALREQTAALAALPPPPAPPELRERIVAAAAGRRVAPAGRPYARWALRAAAAAALFVGGAAVGAALDDAPTVVTEREPAAAEEPVADATPDRGATVAAADAGGDPEPRAAAADEPLEARPTLARDDEPARPPADPAEALRDAEARYVEALARYADEASVAPGADPTSRLAALEGILYTTRAALDATPNDPVLEGFYRSALAQREAILDDVTITTAQAVY